jgi:hypothetical protein
MGFYYCSGLSNVTIPNSVTNIGGLAFLGCSSLRSVTIPKSVISLGSYAFTQCFALGSIFFQGNVPSTDSFGLQSPTVSYYMLGTSGWSSTFAGRPAYLWNPTARTSGPNFGVRTNRFGFNITGTPNIPMVVEANANLAASAWVPLRTCTLTNGLIYFSDPNWKNFPTRAYRIRSP